MEGPQRRRLWKLQGLSQAQPHLPAEPGASGTAAHPTARIQVRGRPRVLRFTLASRNNPGPPPVFCRQYSVGFEVVTVSTVGDPGSSAFQKKNSGEYRCDGSTPTSSPEAGGSRIPVRAVVVEPAGFCFFFLCRCGFCYMEVEQVPAGTYNVTPTTFLPKQEGPFFLDFASTSPLKVSQLQ